MPDEDEIDIDVEPDGDLSGLIGQSVVDVTRHETDRGSYVELAFENGSTIRLPADDDGFEYHEE